MKCGSLPAYQGDANRFPEAPESLPRRHRAPELRQQSVGLHGSPSVRPSPLGCILLATLVKRAPAASP